MGVLSILLWLLVLTGTETPTLEVAWDVDHLEGTPGDTVSVTLGVGWDGDHSEYALRPPTPEPPSALALGPTTTKQRLGAGRTDWLFTYRFVVREPGTSTVPPMTLRYLKKGADTWEEIVSQEIPLTIHEAGQASGTSWWLLVVAGALSVGLALTGYLWVARRRPRPRRGVSDPLAQEALDRIAALERTPGHAAFCQGVSEVVRSYLEQRVGIVLRGKATTDTVRELERRLPPPEHDAVRAVLEDCDRGRFGSIDDGEARSRILGNCRTMLSGENVNEH
jgi:hypothetical protein